MQENYKSRKNDVIRYSERSLPDEYLKLIGFGCNVSGCAWTRSSSKYPFHEALREHGQHNLKEHIDNSRAAITYRYIFK